MLGACRGLIAHLKRASLAHMNATSMSPVAAQQIVSAMHVLKGEAAGNSGRGQAKLTQLVENANFFRGRLLAMGCNVLGSWDSPVMVRPAVVLGDVSAAVTRLHGHHCWPLLHLVNDLQPDRHQVA